jgi:hypothetical protein
MRRIPVTKKISKKFLNEPFILTYHDKPKALVMPYSDYVKVRTLLAHAFIEQQEKVGHV